MRKKVKRKIARYVLAYLVLCGIIFFMSFNKMSNYIREQQAKEPVRKVKVIPNPILKSK